MRDDAPALLDGAGQEAGDVDEGEYGQVEPSAELDEPRGLDGSLGVEDAATGVGLVGQNADRVTVETGEQREDARGVRRHQLESRAVVEHTVEQRVHVE